MKQIFLVVIVVFCVVAMPAGADVVTDWNSAALDSIRSGNTPPPRASRALAILHASIHDAVNGISRTHEQYAVVSSVPASASKEAAASAAAYHVLANLFPSRQPIFETLHESTLATIRDSPQKHAGIAWGEAVAAKMIALRANDGADSIVSLPGGNGPGIWTPTGPGFTPYVLPQWGFVTPFVMSSGSQFRPSGPPVLSSSQWAADFNEVKALGSATSLTRTADQTEIALFWADGAGTHTPPGHWNAIAQHVSAAQGNTLDENARMFALLNLAMADAAISAWDAKYHYNFWRPVSAIPNGGIDGNDATQEDLTWVSLIGTPPFPDYTSGHSTFSGAASRVLALFYGTDAVSFTIGCDALPDVFRTFSSFSAASDEAAESRLYGGIHFRTANQHGLESGLGIGELTVTNYLTPKGNRSRE